MTYGYASRKVMNEAARMQITFHEEVESQADQTNNDQRAIQNVPAVLEIGFRPNYAPPCQNLNGI